MLLWVRNSFLESTVKYQQFKNKVRHHIHSQVRIFTIFFLHKISSLASYLSTAAKMTVTSEGSHLINYRLKPKRICTAGFFYKNNFLWGWNCFLKELHETDNLLKKRRSVGTSPHTGHHVLVTHYIQQVLNRSLKCTCQSCQSPLSNCQTKQQRSNMNQDYVAALPTSHYN